MAVCHLSVILFAVYFQNIFKFVSSFLSIVWSNTFFDVIFLSELEPNRLDKTTNKWNKCTTMYSNNLLKYVCIGNVIVIYNQTKSRLVYPYVWTSFHFYICSIITLSRIYKKFSFVITKIALFLSAMIVKSTSLYVAV